MTRGPSPIGAAVTFPFRTPTAPDPDSNAKKLHKGISEHEQTATTDKQNPIIAITPLGKVRGLRLCFAFQAWRLLCASASI
jgi:hypothetical protein